MRPSLAFAHHPSVPLEPSDVEKLRLGGGHARRGNFGRAEDPGAQGVCPRREDAVQGHFGSATNFLKGKVVGQCFGGATRINWRGAGERQPKDPSRISKKTCSMNGGGRVEGGGWRGGDRRASPFGATVTNTLSVSLNHDRWGVAWNLAIEE